MPAPTNSRVTARSQELTKNLVHTRHQLENHFKSIKRREADFRKQKLVNFEEELKATARMARAAAAPEAAGRQRTLSSGDQSRSEGSLRTKSPERQKALSAFGNSTLPGSLSRSRSSLDGWPNAYAPQFPIEWGGHGMMPKPPGSPAAFPLAVTRACADVPAAQHPPPHPGAHSMSRAPTRSLAAFAASHTATAFSPVPPGAATAPSSPTAAQLHRLPADRSLINASSSKDADDDVISAVPDGEHLIEKDPMIMRLGHFMALLGPRYKTISKEMIWEQAERGERTPAQRRLAKLGGIEAVGGGPDRSLRASASAPGELALAADSDGKARAAWLAARTADRERRNRAARSGAATGR